MNIKLKAAAITAGVLLISAVVAVLLNILPSWVTVSLALAFAAFMMYNLALIQLEMNEKVDEISEKYKD